MTLDHTAISLFKAFMTLAGVIASATLGIMTKGLFLILGMGRETTKALSEQASTNEALRKAIETSNRPCRYPYGEILHHPGHTTGKINLEN